MTRAAILGGGTTFCLADGVKFYMVGGRIDGTLSDVLRWSGGKR